MKKYRQIYDFYIEDSEKSLIKDILPGYYIDQNLGKNKISADFAVKFLQNELNYILNSFVNGGFSYKGFALYPFIKGVSNENMTKIKMLKKVVILLNNNGYDFSGSIGSYRENIESKDFALILSSLYKDLSSIKNKNTVSAKKYKCKELELSTYKKNDLRYLKPLNELKCYANDNLKQYLSGFYIHGSLATKDYIKGWSDVDTLSVVSNGTLQEPEKLLDLRDKMYCMRLFFYKIDPLQHHGSIIITDYDIGNYCQAYFPVPIFRYAKSFFKEDRISKIKIRECSREAFARLFWFVNYFRKLKIEERYDIGSYELKNLLHCITLFPTTYLNAKNIFVYKKFSFGIAKKDLKKEDWKVIDEVSSIRRKWKSTGNFPLIGLSSRINPLLAYQLNSRVMDLFKNIKKINNINTKYLVENMFKLSENAWDNIKQNENKRL